MQRGCERDGMAGGARGGYACAAMTPEGNGRRHLCAHGRIVCPGQWEEWKRGESERRRRPQRWRMCRVLGACDGRYGSTIGACRLVWELGGFAYGVISPTATRAGLRGVERGWVSFRGGGPRARTVAALLAPCGPCQELSVNLSGALSAEDKSQGCVVGSAHEHPLQSPIAHRVASMTSVSKKVGVAAAPQTVQ